MPFITLNTTHPLRREQLATIAQQLTGLTARVLRKDPALTVVRIAAGPEHVTWFAGGRYCRVISHWRSCRSRSPPAPTLYRKKRTGSTRPGNYCELSGTTQSCRIMSRWLNCRELTG